MNKIYYLLLSAFLLSCSCNGEKNERPTIVTPGGGSSSASETAEVKVGEPLPAWTEGEIDIHCINTGRGECNWIILPDGTTVMVDAAGSTLVTNETSMPTAPKPSRSISAGTVITNYVNFFSPEVSRGHINYFVLSHYHEDHMGSIDSTIPTAGDGSFKMTSLSEVGTKLVFDHYMDRTYPDDMCTYQVTYTAEKNIAIKNFVTWSVKNNGTVAEKFRAGALDQIKLVNKPADYNNFSIRNISANGYYWTGQGEESKRIIPSHEELCKLESTAIPDENSFSCAFVISYGAFDFFTGGDHQYGGKTAYAYKDDDGQMIPAFESMGRVIDVAKACHHGTKNCNSYELMKVLSPSVWISNVWRDVQPNPATVDAVWKASPSCAIFMTNMTDRNRETLGEERLAKAKSVQGHVVVRTCSKGSGFYVYVLDDSDQTYRVKEIYGPYKSVK